ncbi:hypothetical protein [Kineococcus rubinsiae]|uniref:hypothetical protein n=1 Tax=Kineococcus rubinsiae TaxID=2609562 RepID=UPI001430CDC0|nr:hypothetical protein [Kineococcus rubinsiae]NIZ90398.1 hypothetical protein [Kineococcus rubinsiae]
MYLREGFPAAWLDAVITWTEVSPSRRVIGAGLVLVVGAVVSGCGGSTSPQVQNVAACIGPSSTYSKGAMVRVELRMGSNVVASGTGPVGSTIGAQVPLGEVSVFADDVLVGVVGSANAPATVGEGEPADVSYFSQSGCPTSPPAI